MKSKLLINLLIILFSSMLSQAQTLQYNWVNQISGTHNVTSKASATDSNGNTFISGIFGSTAGVTTSSIDIGGTTLTATSKDKTYLAKLDNSGNLLWAKNIGSTPNCTSTGGSVACTVLKGCTDPSGNFITAGSFQCPVLIIESATLLNSNTAFTTTEMYVTKHDPSGNLVWAKSFGGIGNDYLNGLHSDANGNLYLAFSFNEPVTIDGTVFSPVALGDALILKLASDGTVIWAEQISSSDGLDARGGIYVDGNDNVYVSGYCGGLDLNFGNITVFPGGPNGYFYLVKYDSLGNAIWVRNSDNSGGQPYPEDISGDQSGNIYITGYFSGFTPVLIGTSSLTGLGGFDMFTVKYDTNGNLLWAKREGGNGWDVAREISVDPNDNVTVIGEHQTGSITLGDTTFVNNNGQDGVVIKYDQSGNMLWANVFGGDSASVTVTGFSISPNGDEIISGDFTGTTLQFGSTILSNVALASDGYIVSIAGSDVINWTGNTSSSWTSPFNWTPQQVPTVNDNVKIPAGRPFDPIIKSGEVANCKKLTIADGAVFRMNAGIIHVHGKITAASASAFQLNGGGMHLYHGSTFPENTQFNNLVIKNETDVDADNVYKFNGFTSVNGNFKVFGTATKPTLPKIVLEEGDDIHIYKNFTFSSGTIGWQYVNPTPTDRSQLPGLFFAGTGVQNIAISNQSGQNSSAVDCNIYMANPAAKFTLPNRELSFFNLIVNDNFNLAGKRLTIIGKIVYGNGIISTYKISNSNPSRGSISIFNDALLVYDNDDQYIRIDKVRALRCNLTTPVTNTILLTAFAADTLEVKGYLDLNGQNLTIGSTSTNLGTLDVESLGTSITQGTLFLYGNAVNPPYQLVALALNNLVLNNPNGVVLNNAINIPLTSPNWSQMLLYGTAKLTAGSFDLNGSLISLVKNTNTNSPNVAKIVETPFNTFLNFGGTGAGPALRIDTNVTTAITNKNYGGLGFFIQSNVPLNQLSIVRSPVEQTGINGGSSIFRTYTIYNQGSAPGMNAFVSIEYDDIELGSTNESDLAIYRRSSDEPAGVWNPVSSIVFTGANVVSSISVTLPSIDYSTSPGGFTQYTLASTSNPPRLMNQSISNSTKIDVYPNPFTSELSAQFTSAIAELATLQVIDITGKVIEERSVQLNKGNNNIDLCCMDELPGGVYFMKITSSQTNSIVKVVKQ